MHEIHMIMTAHRKSLNLVPSKALIAAVELCRKHGLIISGVTDFVGLSQYKASAARRKKVRTEEDIEAYRLKRRARYVELQQKRAAARLAAAGDR